MDEPAPRGDRLMGAGWAAPAGPEPCQLAPRAADRPPVTQGHRKNLPPLTNHPSGPNVSESKLGHSSVTPTDPAKGPSHPPQPQLCHVLPHQRSDGVLEGNREGGEGRKKKGRGGKRERGRKRGRGGKRGRGAEKRGGEGQVGGGLTGNRGTAGPHCPWWNSLASL